MRRILSTTFIPSSNGEISPSIKKKEQESKTPVSNRLVESNPVDSRTWNRTQFPNFRNWTALDKSAKKGRGYIRNWL